MIYDIAILGTGIGGTLLGSILARHGMKVLMFDAESHPRFTIGESTIPETTFLLRVLAERYDVPEFLNLVNYARVRSHVSSACGIKRSFSFVYHRPDEPQRPDEAHQYPTLAPPIGPDIHYFRQDIDAYLFNVAVGYGAVAAQRTTIEDFDFQEDLVVMKTAEGKEYRAKFVVDAAGIRSPLARKFGLREEPTQMRTHSRSLFTHMVDVKPYDEVFSHRAHGLPSPLAQSTLHHVFPGGWMWVIPFDNDRHSTNRLCSVGLNFDLAVHPPRNLAPEAEFRDWIARFPNIARQFSEARAVRAWTSSGRLQYRTHRVVGHRYSLIAHSSGFIDPLFSSGMAMTVAGINLLAQRLIDAVEEDDFAEARFAPLESMLQRSMDHVDRMVACSYIAFRNFELWNAWYRLWVLGGLYATLGVCSVGSYDDFERAPYSAVQSADFPEFKALFDASAEHVEAFDRGEVSAAAASEAIFALLAARTDLAPRRWDIANPARRCPTTLTLLPLLGFEQWRWFQSPPAIRKDYRNIRLWNIYGKFFVDTNVHEVGRMTGEIWRLLRDNFVSWNEDWRRDGPRARSARRPARTVIS